MTVHGADISHRQPVPDFAAFRAAGGRFLFAKCTEGTTFVDPNFGANRKGAHDEGVFFGAYHFARPGDPVAQARWFLAHAALGPGELPLLDMEDQAISDPVGWSAAWVATVKAAYGVAAPDYLNQAFLTGHNWQRLVDLDSGLWLARYDGDPNPTGPTGQWPAIAFKQYSDKGTMPGIPGLIDVDSFNGDETAMRRYGIKAPAPIPHPQPVPHPPVLGWNLPMGHYYGNARGPANCHGGVYPAERAFISNIKRWFVFHGVAKGHFSSTWATSPWCTGDWGRETDAACALWHERFYPHQPEPLQIWGDDYRRLASL